jgi:hypothetical protein
LAESTSSWPKPVTVSRRSELHTLSGDSLVDPDTLKITQENLQLKIAAAEKARKDVEVTISPQLEHLRKNYDASIKYADQAIRSGFFMNGGALVLFSGYAAHKGRRRPPVLKLRARPRSALASDRQ